LPADAAQRRFGSVIIEDGVQHLGGREQFLSALGIQQQLARNVMPRIIKSVPIIALHQDPSKEVCKL
jgi:hypothetical protein